MSIDSITFVGLIRGLSEFVLIASVINLLMPPLEWFTKFPKFYKWYEFFLMVLTHYASLNFRAALWSKYLDTKVSNTT